MSNIGDELAELDAAFSEWLEDDLEVTNYEESDTQPAADEYDGEDKVATASSPIATRGSVDDPNVSSSFGAWGVETTADAVIFIPDDVTVSEGETSGLPYPSEIEEVSTGRVFRVESLYDEGNGRQRIEAMLIRRP